MVERQTLWYRVERDWQLLKLEFKKILPVNESARRIPFRIKGMKVELVPIGDENPQMEGTILHDIERTITARNAARMWEYLDAVWSAPTHEPSRIGWKILESICRDWRECGDL